MSTELAPTTTEAPKFSAISAKALRDQYKLSHPDAKAKDVKAYVNEQLRLSQPAADAAFAKLRQDGFTVTRFAETKGGNFTLTLTKPGKDAAANLKAQLEERDRKIAEMEAKLAALQSEQPKTETPATEAK